MLIVLPGSTTAGGAQGGFGSMPTITWDDLRAIQGEVPTVRYAVAVLRTNAQILTLGAPVIHSLDRSRSYVQTATTELVYRFNWGGPVVAKY